MAWTRADQAKQNLNVLLGNCQWNGRTWWGGRGEKKLQLLRSYQPIWFLISLMIYFLLCLAFLFILTIYKYIILEFLFVLSHTYYRIMCLARSSIFLDISAIFILLYSTFCTIQYNYCTIHRRQEITQIKIWFDMNFLISLKMYILGYSEFDVEGKLKHRKFKF